MSNKEYLDYLRVTGMDLGEIKYDIDLRFSKIDIDIINYIESYGVEIKDICEALRNKGVEIKGVIYFIGLLMIHINDEDDFRFLLEDVLKPRVMREYNLKKYIEEMISNLSINLYYSFGDINSILKSGDDI